MADIPKTWTTPAGNKAHFIAEVNDGDVLLVAFKYWQPHRQCWAYGLEEKYLVEIALRNYQK